MMRNPAADLPSPSAKERERRELAKDTASFLVASEITHIPAGYHAQPFHAVWSPADFCLRDARYLETRD
jgi:hypothetical protein